MVEVKKPKIFKNRGDAPKEAKVIETLDIALCELFFISNPSLKKGMPEAQQALATFLSNKTIDDVWVYYPQEDVLIHTPTEEIYFKLRTARNRNIISTEEQLAYRNIKVGIAGLSVGSSVLSALVTTGGPKTLKIADFDTVEITNLNRIRASLLDIGQNKTTIAAREIWRVDPFADLHLWADGLDDRNIKDFIIGEPPVDIFVDEMDTIALKILGRVICKENRIPVIMATDNGDGIILDIERFDSEPERPIFHGLVENSDIANIQNIDFKAWLKLATKIVGPEYLTERMQESILQIGKTLPAVPQIGTAASLSGAAVAFAVRKIANKQSMPSGRYALDLAERFDPNYSSPENIETRREKTELFRRKFGSDES